MNKTIYALLMLVAVATGFLACSSDNDEVELTSDCFISSFQMTAVRRVVTTTATSGADSTYYTTTNASSMRMRIDQLGGTITNVDLLPTGSLLDKVLVTVAGKGTIAYAPAADTTSWTLHQAKDSIDFTDTVIFRVIASNGNGYRDYRVKLRVRDNDASGYTWNKVGTVEDMPAATSSKLLFHPSQDGTSVRPLLFISDDEGNTYVSHPSVDVSSETDVAMTNWRTTPCQGFPGGDVRSVVSFSGSLWATDADGLVYRSLTGETWERVAQSTASDGLRLFAASGTALYAMATNEASSMVVTSADGASWQAMSAESDVFGASVAGTAYTQDNGNHRVMLMTTPVVGNTADGLSVWNLLEGSGEAWFCFNDGSVANALPRWEHPVVLPYNGWLIAFGGSSADGAHTPLDALYISRDNGINWQTDSNLKAPDGLKGSSEVISAAAYGEYVWVVAGDALWTLRYNSVGE